MKSTKNTSITAATTATAPVSTLVKHQVKSYLKELSPTEAKQYGFDTIKVEIRYDDQCGNGHNSFGITAETWLNNREECGGCLHDEISVHFPEFRHLIRWHMMNSDGPLYYIENTTYFASDKDYNGLREGEKKQLMRAGKEPCWKRVIKTVSGDEIDFMGYEKNSAYGARPEDIEAVLTWEPVYIYGKGKKIDLEAARRSAIWPGATLEQLQSKEALLERLPSLILQFKTDVEALGFQF